MGTQITNQGALYNSAIYQGEPLEAAALEKSAQAEVAIEAPATPAANAAPVTDSFTTATEAGKAVKPLANQSTAGAFAPTAAGQVQSTQAAGINPCILQQYGRELSDALDIGKSMTVANYNNCMKKLSGQSGYYMQTKAKAENTLKSIEQNIASLQGKDPVDEAQLNQLKELKELAGGVVTLYGHLAQAGGASETARAEQAAVFMQDITALQNAMLELDPNLIGDQAYTSMLASMRDMTDLAFAFSTIKYNENTGTPSKLLGAFVLQTFRRLQQIEKGDRKRENETADISGALNTYANDVRDWGQFMATFAATRRNVVENGITDEAEVAAMLKNAVKGTSERFQANMDLLAKTYVNLAEAEMHHKVAKEELKAAQEALKNGENELLASQTDLLNADMAVSAGIEYISPRSAVQKQLTRADAENALSTASDLNASAKVHIDNYREYKATGEAAATRAHAEATVAENSLNLAENWNNLVKEGPQGKYFQKETGAIDGEIASQRCDLAAIKDGAGEIVKEFSRLDAFSYDLLQQRDYMAQKILGLDVGISTDKLMETAGELGTKGVDTAYDRMLAVIKASGAKRSAKLDSFLKDPEGFLQKFPSEEGNMRKELTELFEDNPALADSVAHAINDMRVDFNALRRDLENKVRQLGEDPKKGRFATVLDVTENTLLNGLAAKNPLLFTALMSSGSKSAEVAKTVSWMQDLQKSMIRHTVGNEGLRQQAIESYNRMLESNPTAPQKVNLDKRIAEYGQPVATECISIFQGQGYLNGNMNIPIFKKDGKYLALDPYSNNIYTSATKEGAMAALAAGVNWVEGQVSYLDSQGNVKVQDTHLPPDTRVKDIAFGVAGIVGGIILVAIPEPTMVTKGAGVALISSSAAYFLDKGIREISDQVSHDNFDLSRPESRAAVMDIVSGVTTLAGGAGSLLGTGASTVGRVTTGVKVAGALNNTAKFGNMLNLGYTTQENVLTMIDVWNNNSLSTGERWSQTASLVGGICMAGASCSDTFMSHAPTAKSATLSLGLAEGNVALQTGEALNNSYNSGDLLSSDSNSFVNEDLRIIMNWANGGQPLK